MTSSMQMPYDLHEAKHAEVQQHPHRRGAKDDAKQQQKQSRTVQQHVDALEERVRTSELGQQAAQGIDRAKVIAQQGMDKIAEMASSSGASVATAAAQQPRAILPLSTNDYSFSSIPDRVGMRRPILKPGSVSSRSKDRIGLTGDPLPSWETPSEVGMETAQGIEAMKAKLSPVLDGAKQSLYSMWKRSGLYAKAPQEQQQQTVRSSKPSVGEQASAALAKGKEVYAEQVQPALSKMSAQAQVLMQEKVIPAAQSGMASAQHLYNEQVAPKVQSGIATVQDKMSGMGQTEVGASQQRPAGLTLRQRMTGAYEAKVPEVHRVRLARARGSVMNKLRWAKNKAIDVWEGEEPTLHEYANRGMKVVRDYKMELPLMALGSLLLLWALVAFVGWWAFPATPIAAREQMVVYHPHTMGPELGPDNAGTIERMKGQIKGVDSKIMEGLDSIKMRAEDGIGHIKDAMPTIPSVDDIKTRAADLKGHVVDAIPSTESVKAAMPNMPSMPSMGEVKSRAAGVKDQIVDAIPSTEAIKNAIPSTDAIRDAMPSVSINPQPMMSKLPSERTILSRIEAGIAKLTQSDTALKIKDRASHAASLLPEQVSQLRARMGDLVDRLTPAQQHFAYTHADVLSPEDHVIEWKDGAGHVKEGLAI